MIIIDIKNFIKYIFNISNKHRIKNTVIIVEIIKNHKNKILQQSQNIKFCVQDNTVDYEKLLVNNQIIVHLE